jgi:hypothetical protein
VEGEESAEKAAMTVWVYVNTSKQVGDPDHLKIFSDPDIARRWFERFDPKGVAVEYPVIGDAPGMIRRPAP